MAKWDAWIGREKEQNDYLDLALARRWSDTFDLALPNDGTMLQGIHFCLCTPEAPQSQLGEDGHPMRDNSDASFFPPIPLPRRMWAASQINFTRPLVIGKRINRRSRIISISEKEGKTGSLGFVEVEHLTQSENVTAIREKQTLVYRDSAGPDIPLSPPNVLSETFESSEWENHKLFRPDPTLLFRFSALTFNTHRIHYDLPYSSDVERYRGLVVHGPLIASLLLQMASESLGPNKLKSFAFRAVSPAIANDSLHLVMRRKDAGSLELAAFAGDSRIIMRASGSTAP